MLKAHSAATLLNNLRPGALVLRLVSGRYCSCADLHAGTHRLPTLLTVARGRERTKVSLNKLLTDTTAEESGSLLQKRIHSLQVNTPQHERGDKTNQLTTFTMTGYEIQKGSPSPDCNLLTNREAFYAYIQ